MDKNRVREYYDMLKYYYLKPDSDWTDKAKSIRTVANDFYNEITRTNGRFADALNEFYKWNKNNEVYNCAIALKNRLNIVVHQNQEVDKETFLTFYYTLVKLIYLTTGIHPDAATKEFIGLRSSDELDGLNDEQKDAVLCDDQIIYVSAGPGTGKTHLLINKLLHYISASSKPEKIVALSYTNTAANELGERFHKATFECGTTKPFEFYNGTIHAFCFKMIKSYYTTIGKEFNYIIIDDTDIEELAEELRIQLNDLYKKEDIKESLKSHLRCQNPQLKQLIADMKSRFNIISIEDILTSFIDLLGDNEFRQWFKDQVSVLVIDEAQDLTDFNYKIFDILLQVNPSLKMFLVGDPRQNIFGFIGGSNEHLDAFLSRHSNYTRKNLTGTYRCPQPVCDYVNTFCFLDSDNPPLRSIGGNTGKVNVFGCVNEESESLKVLGIVRRINDLNNTAVLCNKLNYMKGFIDLLVKAGIPYRVFGGQKFVKMHIKIFNHLLRIIDSGNVYSINVIIKAFKLQLDKMTGSNVTEKFYNTTEGRILKVIKDDIERKSRINGVVSLKVIADTLIEHFFNNGDEAINNDLKALEGMMAQYNTIADYLLSFAIDRESFSRFFEKNYVECKVPVTDKYLTVSTIHSAKGLEWKNVIVMGLSEGNFPSMWFAKNERGVNGYLKSMFVAATRTKGDLYLTYAQKNPWGHSKVPSRFLWTLLQPEKDYVTCKTIYYIIDTNVFIDRPDIINKIDKDYPVILSTKVVDELDKMKIKLKDQGKENAERALWILNRILNNERHDRKVITEFADTSLLPDDLDKKSPDNMILSIALKYKDENPIILTSDNGLQLKAKLFKINTISLKYFLKEQ